MIFQQTHGHKENALALSVSPEIQGQRASGRKQGGCSSGSMLKYHKKPGVHNPGGFFILFLLEVIFIFY